MKAIIKNTCLFITFTLLLASCKKFNEINVDPTAANTSQVQVEYFINNSIVHAQLNPGVSERSFILYWQAAGHQISDADGETFSWGNYSDEWISEYYNNQSDALNYVNSAIDVANQQIAANTSKPYTSNLAQVARIWRAYLLSEMSDCFGPMPIQGFQGKNPDFVDVKSVYYYVLDELKDASSKIDVSVSASDISSEDPAFGFNFTNWRKYANSLRLRLAMRLSEVDKSKAQSEFEDAAKGDLLTDNSQNLQIQEKTGYNDLSGMYTRCWYLLPVGVTLNNLMVNLGGIKSQDQLPTVITDTTLAAAISNIKPANYIGETFPGYLSTKTNDPSAGYWLDGMPYTIDPRAYQIFYIPGNINSATFPDGTCGAIDNNTIGHIKDINNSNQTLKTVDAKFTWNAIPDGEWGALGDWHNSFNELVDIGSTNGKTPSLKNEYRTQSAKRLFFGSWETYFLLAEGAEKGWTSPVGAQQAYETGISKSFDYWGTSQYYSSYITSTDYNRAGTSVSWNHIVEPGNNHIMNYKNGFTETTGSATINYPVNNLYKNGSVKNDHLTKIITQKFIAQTPWLPLETWSDHRRLGLPFFENVVLENPIQTLPALTSANYMTSSVKFFPQRMKYPSSLQNSNSSGYKQATSALSGTDDVLTPLWWAQH